MLFAGTVSGHIAVDEFEMITKMLLEWSNENGTRDVWFFHNVLVYHRDLKTNSWILLEAPSKMTDMTQLEQILLSSWKMFLEKKTADWELCSNGLVQSFCKFKVPNIHNLTNTLWLWWRSLWSNGIEKHGHSTNRFSPFTTHFSFIFHPEHIPIHLFFISKLEMCKEKTWGRETTATLLKLYENYFARRGNLFCTTILKMPTEWLFMGQG